MFHLEYKQLALCRAGRLVTVYDRHERQFLLQLKGARSFGVLHSRKGAAVAQLVEALRYKKVAGSIADGVIGIFQ
jgi:hypothetical protein